MRAYVRAFSLADSLCQDAMKAHSYFAREFEHFWQMSSSGMPCSAVESDSAWLGPCKIVCVAKNVCIARCLHAAEPYPYPLHHLYVSVRRLTCQLQRTYVRTYVTKRCIAQPFRDEAVCQKTKRVCVCVCVCVCGSGGVHFGWGGEGGDG